MNFDNYYNSNNVNYNINNIDKNQETTKNKSEIFLNEKNQMEKINKKRRYIWSIIIEK